MVFQSHHTILGHLTWLTPTHYSCWCGSNNTQSTFLPRMMTFRIFFCWLPLENKRSSFVKRYFVVYHLGEIVSLKFCNMSTIYWRYRISSTLVHVADNSSLWHIDTPRGMKLYKVLPALLISLVSYAEWQHQQQSKCKHFIKENPFGILSAWCQSLCSAPSGFIARTHGCVRNDSETHKTVLLDCMTGEATSAIQ